MVLNHRHTFQSRQEAGQKLGEYLLKRNITNPFIFALPRGGIPVAHEVAHILHTSLDVVVARKIGAPDHPEYGIGAMSEDEAPLFNPDIAGYININDPIVQATIVSEQAELKRRIIHYRSGHKLPSMKNRTIILVDDGLATGVTAAAAGKFLRTLDPKEIILAVPVGPQEVSQIVKNQFDEILCLHRPENFRAVGLWYENFEQVEDKEVMNILNKYH